MSQEFDQSLSTVSKEEIGSTGITVGYRAISVLAVIAFVFSLFTPLMLLSNWFVICPLLGAICGLFGLYRILSCPFDYAGRNFALAGIIFSLVLGLAASGWEIWNYYFSIPYGYTVINFLDLRPDSKTNKLPEHIIAIAKEHRKVYLRGFMYPGRQLAGIENFMLVRTVSHCKFCSPEQNPFDMISVHCVGDLKVPFRTRAVHIGGELYVNPEFRYGELPYHIEADLFR
ncbi:MAG: hypothetical protein LBU34_07855 [Planctomycetaceae bacterium]|jgi:hypothetical protein|nr:hypothetical protein [Planctomycetaceae bacterium]